MRNTIIATAAVLMATSFAYAQDQSAPSPQSNLPMGRVKSMIEGQGYRNITGLRYENGVWRATARKGGKNVDVRFYSRGNIQAR